MVSIAENTDYFRVPRVPTLQIPRTQTLHCFERPGQHSFCPILLIRSTAPRLPPIPSVDCLIFNSNILAPRLQTCAPIVLKNRHCASRQHLTLTATSAASTRSNARQTSLKPPLPRRLSNTYLESIGETVGQQEVVGDYESQANGNVSIARPQY